MRSIRQLIPSSLSFKRFKSNVPINVTNYETGFSQPKTQSIADELDLLSLAYNPETGEAAALNDAAASDGQNGASSVRRPNRSVTSKYPTGTVARLRCYNCGQMGHISFDCQQPQVRKACYTCGNSGHLARDCPQSQRPVVCYVCRQPGHLASICPNAPNSHNGL